MYAHGPAQASVRQRGSISSRFTNTLLRAETQNTSTSRLRSNSGNSNDAEEDATIKHPVEPRARTAILPPVLVSADTSSHKPQAILLPQIYSDKSQSKSIDPDPLCWLTFTEDSIITSCKTGKRLFPPQLHVTTTFGEQSRFCM